MELDALVLEPVAEHGNEAVGVTGGVEGKAEFPYRVYLILPLKPGPLLGLSSLDKADQSVDVQAQLRVVCVSTFGVAAGRGEEGGFDVGFKAFFGRFQHFSPCKQ